MITAVRRQHWQKLGGETGPKTGQPELALTHPTETEAECSVPITAFTLLCEDALTSAISFRKFPPSAPRIPPHPTARRSRCIFCTAALHDYLPRPPTTRPISPHRPVAANIPSLGEGFSPPPDRADVRPHWTMGSRPVPPPLRPHRVPLDVSKRDALFAGVHSAAEVPVLPQMSAATPTRVQILGIPPMNPPE